MKKNRIVIELSEEFGNELVASADKANGRRGGSYEGM